MCCVATRDHLTVKMLSSLLTPHMEESSLLDLNYKTFDINSSQTNSRPTAFSPHEITHVFKYQTSANVSEKLAGRRTKFTSTPSLSYDEELVRYPDVLKRQTNAIFKYNSSLIIDLDDDNEVGHSNCRSQSCFWVNSIGLTVKPLKFLMFEWLGRMKTTPFLLPSNGTKFARCFCTQAKERPSHS